MRYTLVGFFIHKRNNNMDGNTEDQKEVVNTDGVDTTNETVEAPETEEGTAHEKEVAQNMEANGLIPEDKTVEEVEEEKKEEDEETA